VDDPTNILGEAADDLKKVAEAIRRQIEESEPVDNLQFPPELSPNTSDNNIIHVDPDPGPYSPPNPVAPTNGQETSGHPCNRQVVQKMRLRGNRSVGSAFSA
jgi:hypothetical protein